MSLFSLPVCSAVCTLDGVVKGPYAHGQSMDPTIDAHRRIQTATGDGCLLISLDPSLQMTVVDMLVSASDIAVQGFDNGVGSKIAAFSESSVY